MIGILKSTKERYSTWQTNKTHIAKKHLKVSSKEFNSKLHLADKNESLSSLELFFPRVKADTTAPHLKIYCKAIGNLD